MTERAILGALAPALRADVAIVGGGPAGLAAAIALRERGIEHVVVLERESEAGGVPRHCGHPPFGMREFGRVLTGPHYARRLVEKALRCGVDIRLGLSVIRLDPGGRLSAVCASGPVTIEADRVILATGTREATRAAQLVTGQRPLGVLNTGALQAYIYLQGLIPFRRPLIVGTELVAMSAILTCLRHGIRPVAMVETETRPQTRWPLGLFPRLMGIPVHYGARIADIAGESRVQSVSIVTADGSNSQIACDGVLFTGHFTPEASLVRASAMTLDQRTGGPSIDSLGRCSDPAYFAAGNLLRPVETAGWCFREGRRIGHLVADDLAAPAQEGAIDVRAGEGVRYVVPQRIAPDRPKLDLQLRAGVTGRCRLVLSSGGRIIWSRVVAARPERRIVIPIQRLAIPAGTGFIEVAIQPLS